MGRAARLIPLQSEWYTDAMKQTGVNQMNGENMEALYREAKSRYDHRANEDDVAAAEAMFRELGDYADAPAYVEKCETLKRFAVGRTVEFGAGLRWRVVDLRGRMRLLLAERDVAYRAYDDRLRDTSWAECSLRKWLNHAFLEEAFTPQERTRIVSGVVRNRRSPKFFTNGGANTVDKVFIPDMEEILRYLPAEADRAGDGWWWLRTPGCNLLSAASVYTDGSIYDIGIHVNYPAGGVRPMLWVLLRV